VNAGPPSSPVSIRPARPGEAAALAALMERTFRDTYSANSTASELEKFVAGHFGPEQQRRELADPALVTLLAEVGEPGAERPVAFAQIRPRCGRGVPACVGALRPAELMRFYVEHAWHGRGVAAPLMAACIAAAVEAGADALWLMVYRINERAIAFYRRQGFAPVGTSPFRFGDEIHQDVVMARPLVGQRPGPAGVPDEAAS
jgi:diamine N-acetyltransferase